jgi:hypothetical protein
MNDTCIAGELQFIRMASNHKTAWSVTALHSRNSPTCRFYSGGVSSLVSKFYSIILCPDVTPFETAMVPTLQMHSSSVSIGMSDRKRKGIRRHFAAGESDSPHRTMLEQIEEGLWQSHRACWGSTEHKSSFSIPVPQRIHINVSSSASTSAQHGQRARAQAASGTAYTQPAVKPERARAQRQDPQHSFQDMEACNTLTHRPGWRDGRRASRGPRRARAHGPKSACRRPERRMRARTRLCSRWNSR